MLATEDELFKKALIKYQFQYGKKLDHDLVITLIKCYNLIPLDALNTLVDFCIKHQKLTSSYLLKTAKDWNTLQIKSKEEAESRLIVFSQKYTTYLKKLNIKKDSVTLKEKNMIDEWFFIFPDNPEIIDYACLKAVESCGGSSSISYVHTILLQWKQRNIKTIDDVTKKTKEKPSTIRFHNYENSTTKEVADEFEQLFLNQTNR